jgi:hypothetical protein
LHSAAPAAAAAVDTGIDFDVVAVAAVVAAVSLFFFFVGNGSPPECARADHGHSSSQVSSDHQVICRVHRCIVTATLGNLLFWGGKIQIPPSEMVTCLES